MMMMALFKMVMMMMMAMFKMVSLPSIFSLSEQESIKVWAITERQESVVT